MGLLKLSPDCVHLRRIAKAYGAGECSTAQYRQARARIIDNFQRLPQSDETQRRYLEERTQRLDDSTERLVELAQSQRFGAQALASSVSEPLPRRLFSERWVFALLLVILVLLTLRAAPSLAAVAVAAPIDIPAVAERDPNPATSQRLVVNAVQLKGLATNIGEPRYSGLDAAAVNDQIDTAIARIRERHKLASHGFSDPELQEVGRLLSAFGAHETGASLSASESQALLDLIATQKQRRGLSVAELEEVATAVQSYVRGRGYFLASVFVPSQRVVDGVVQLSMLPGTLGDVTINGSDSQLVRAELEDLEGDVLTRSKLETRLFRISQLPGIRTQASLKPGSDVGATDLAVDVLEQRRFSGIVQLDNHGLEDTGELRLGTRLEWRNPWRGGDLLEVGARTSVDPTSQQQLWGRYEMPFRRTPYRLELFVGNNRYDFDSIQGINADLDGDSRLFELGMRRTYWQTRQSSGHARLKVGWHNLTWRELESQRLWFTNLAATGHKVWDRSQIALNGRVEIEYGFVTGGEVPGQDSSFYRLSSNGMVWTPVDLPRLPGAQKIALRWQVQYANSELPATRALGFGGPHLNRGFERTQYLADRGLVLGAELRFGLPLGELVTYIDAAYGNGENDREESWAQLTSIGIGWDADWGPGFTSRLSLGLPVSGDGSPGISPPGAQLYWKLQYAY
ncbi:MAG: ShlB/FhaC/HecB family hemolysin secretion/activation protein [Pseudomonadales bacterium]